MGSIYISSDDLKDDSVSYICDGSNDHKEINQALKDAGQDDSTVHFKGPFRYVIDSPLLMYKNTVLEGDKTAVLTIKDNSSLGKDVPLIKQASPSRTNKGKLTLRNFEIDGNYAGNSDDPRGKSFRTLMWFYYDDVEVYDMYLHDGHNDGLKVHYSNSVKFYRNKIYKLGHDALYALQCQNIDYYNNDCRTKTNSACRLYNSNHAKIHDNTIYTQFEEDAGGPGIQIQYIRESNIDVIMDDIEVYNNKIYDTYGPGVWLIAYGNNNTPYAKSEACNVHIHHNTFKGCGTHKTYDWLTGIETSGFYDTLIEDNVFDGCYGAAVLADYFSSGLAPDGKDGKYKIFVKNNTIKNTQKMKCGKGGQGLRNEYPETHTIISESNYIYDNEEGPYFNVSSTSDIYHAPDIPEIPGKPAFLMLECTEAELSEIEKTYPKRTILRKI